MKLLILNKNKLLFLLQKYLQIPAIKIQIKLVINPQIKVIKKLINQTFWLFLKTAQKAIA